ncbi:MAG: phage baseplate assembly protein V [Acidibrevibacterium sp.]|jgi:phage baseplate assembly protein gpV|uniref:phage baseplate assembly protein V n=1 Tax=Acidibrevibacterium fodinaquatile TaxID=1969806 RepID=UPI0023A80459|nr:phage baseplate assembly protein V [Acidibrevibacterium fodinaquatile]MCA7118175.1 phage baseplate assembly protein V [Acidibrevibacterium fodinaquatile]
MERFLNALRAHAGALDQAIAQPRFALVSSVDPTSYTARVLLQPEGVLSGWLPIITAWVGNGWGLAAPPSPGDQVLVIAHEGDSEHGIIVGGAFSLAAPPPQAPAGEFWLVHQSGSFVKLLADGSIAVNATTLNVTGNLSVNGTITATGDVADGHGTLASLRATYDEHTHTVTGTTTSPPSPQN